MLAEVAEVADEVLSPRRDRVNLRVVKRRMSMWQKKRPCRLDYPEPAKEFRAFIEVTR